MRVFNRSVLLALPLISALAACDTYGQGYYRFLGNPVQVPDQTSEQYGIRYNTQGFDHPREHRTSKMIAKGAPQTDVNAVANFPDEPRAFSKWIDSAFEQTGQEFAACGGVLSLKASQVSPKTVYIIIEPTGFYVPELGYAVAGAYFPATHQIQVLNIYYIWSGPNKGWLRVASDLLKWEMENYFAVESGIQAEPRTPHWPCDAPGQ